MDRYEPTQHLCPPSPERVHPRSVRGSGQIPGSIPSPTDAARYATPAPWTLPLPPPVRVVRGGKTGQTSPARSPPLGRPPQWSGLAVTRQRQRLAAASAGGLNQTHLTDRPRLRADRCSIGYTCSRRPRVTQCTCCAMTQDVSTEGSPVDSFHQVVIGICFCSVVSIFILSVLSHLKLEENLIFLRSRFSLCNLLKISVIYEGSNFVNFFLPKMTCHSTKILLSPKIISLLFTFF